MDTSPTLNLHQKVVRRRRKIVGTVKKQTVAFKRVGKRKITLSVPEMRVTEPYIKNQLEDILIKPKVRKQKRVRHLKVTVISEENSTNSGQVIEPTIEQTVQDILSEHITDVEPSINHEEYVQEMPTIEEIHETPVADSLNIETTPIAPVSEYISTPIIHIEIVEEARTVTRVGPTSPIRSGNILKKIFRFVTGIFTTFAKRDPRFQQKA